MDEYVGYTGYGDASECETCGFNMDTLDVDKDLVTGLFEVSLVTGCYNWIADHELTKEQALEWLKYYRYEDYMLNEFHEAIMFVEAH